MSEANPKRKFWQFHLLTLVLMTLATGGMIYLNMTQRIALEYQNKSGHHTMGNAYGWPLTCYECDVPWTLRLENFTEKQCRIPGSFGYGLFSI